MADVNKLPKWAQELLMVKEHEIRMLREKLDSMKLKESNTYYTIGMERFYLPNDVNVHFCREKSKGEEYIISRHDKENVAVLGDLALRVRDGQLRIEPQASNSVHLYTNRRY